MALMMEVEDDVFFADLNRQISLLITDDEDRDDVYYSPPLSFYPSAISIDQGYSRTSIFPKAEPHYQYDQINYHASIDQSKGTGVFIPKSSQWSRSRRSKYQPTRTANTNNNYYYNSCNTNNIRHQQNLQSQAVFSQGIIGSKKC